MIQIYQFCQTMLIYNWHDKLDKVPADCIGFVYIITNTTNNRKYIGKKLAKFAKTKYRIVKLKNGKKKRKKIREKILR